MARGTNETSGTPGASPSQNLTGRLLVAMPGLRDPHFHRSVLYLSHHDRQSGSLGFIINRPILKNFGEMAVISGALSGIPVFEGGPVEPRSLLPTRLFWTPEGARFEPLCDEDIARHSLLPSPLCGHTNYRAFIGYSGWSAGQLEEEISEQSWHIMPPTSELIEPVRTLDEGASLWKEIMRQAGPWHRLMAEAPDDPGMN